ncbi:hypothetical protein KQ51_01208 [Candidatus Izimaplasma bacterium HR1]|jgi:multimeric flavodoxin WrbA|uniref:flavodoxin family protein n=1 Tax=Candidatus Izimoplasma sp. HR1 TaxID=1541959 RepID=UPI0004F920F0|nr:hypothetical protein KQ51_01208 [Candidatus Izimaplasma bacterium HR1]
MKTAIINTTENILTETDFNNEEISIINTRTLNLKYCKGCFDCWTKTPGLCIQKDDMPLILQTIMNSDLTVYISDVKVGFVSSELKKVLDKTIPLIHPYFDIIHGEVHHAARYDSYPEIALVLTGDKEISDPVFDIIQNWYTRFSHNMRTSVKFVIKDNSLLGGLKNEISNY